MLITRDWYLEVNAVPLACPAWEIPDLDELLKQPDLRGLGGLVMPNARGRRSYAPLVDATTYGPIPLDINGNLDVDGDPTSVPLEAMVEHRDYLAANLGFEKQTDRGLVEVILHRGDLPTLVGDAMFLGLKGWTTLGLSREARTTFDLWVPGGELVETGS